MVFATLMTGCNTEKSNTKSVVEELKEKEFTSDTLTIHLKPFNPELQTERKSLRGLAVANNCKRTTRI